MHVSLIYIVVIGIVLHLFLNYTTLGRGIYAVGSDKSVAIRTGFNLRRIYLVVFAIMGGLAGFAGVVYGGLNAYFPPVMLIGKTCRCWPRLSWAALQRLVDADLLLACSWAPS
jgi:ribose/xylose/arabinose/galactoside ABC-type transport system permease subunit